MTDKDVKKLKRVELLEMLIEQTEENEKLRSQLAQLEEKLSQRTITLENAGSIADAALALNDVFKQAQAAADHYLDSIRQKQEACEKETEKLLREATDRCAAMEKESLEKCAAQEKASLEKCASREKETAEKCASQEAQSRTECEKMLADAKAEIEQMKQQLLANPAESQPAAETPTRRGWLFGRRG